MKSDTAFSIVMPICQRKDLFELFPEVIRTVYGGTLIPSEVVIVIDGQLDFEFMSLVAQMSVQYEFKILETSGKVGLSKALNYAIHHCSTDVIVRCDGDDFNHIDRFCKIIDKIEQGYDLVGSSVLEISPERKPLFVKQVPSEHNDIKRFCLRRNPFNHMTVAFRKSMWEQVGGYPSVYLREDWALWAEMLSHGAMTYNFSECLVYASAGEGMYRRRGGIKNIVGEFFIQILLTKKLNKRISLALFDFLIKSVILCAPIFVRRYIYTNFLRHSA